MSQPEKVKSRSKGRIKAKMIGIRACDCGSYVGLTFYQGDWKIWNCAKHGVICPFDNWQFKTVEGLLEHLRHQTIHYREEPNEPVRCEGIFQAGNYAVNGVIFEATVHKNWLSKLTTKQWVKVV